MSDEDAGARGTTLRFTVLGMPVRVPLSGLIGVALIAWLWTPTFSRGTGGGSGVVAAIAFAALLYLGILVHELAHGLTARRLGNRVHSITLWILGGFTVYERAGLTARREAAIAASGPLTTLAYAGVAEVALRVLSGTAPDSVLLVLDALVWTNVLLGVMNLLPGLPLDGGGIVRAAVWGATGSEHKGTVVAAWCGRVLAIVVVIVPLVAAALPGSQVGLLTAAVAAVFGVFVWTGATASLRSATFEQRIPALRAGALARRAVPAAGNESLALAQQRMAEAQAGAIVVLDPAGRPSGVVNSAAAAATPVERRPWVPVSSLATPLPDTAVAESLSGHELIDSLREASAPAVLVHDGSGAIYGVLFIEDIEQALA